MKRIFVAIMALGALVSCSKDELVSVNRQAIQFGESFVGNATRAIDPSHVATDINEFQVWGTMTGASNTVNLFAGANVTRGNAANGAAFTCTQTEYWVPDASYVFAAVANHNGVTATSGLPETIAFTYTDGTKDLLYTKTTNNVTTNASAAPTTGVNTSGIVNFTFDHLLSKLQFKFVNGATDAKHIFKVKDIKIAGLPASGTYTVGAETPWEATGNTGTAMFGNASNATTATATAVDIKQNAPITSNYARLVIPHTAANLTITFVKELYYDADGDGVADASELIYSDANKTTDDKCTSLSLKNQAFAPNGNYVLVATLTSGSKIEFTVQALSDWATSADITLQ